MSFTTLILSQPMAEDAKTPTFEKAPDQRIVLTSLSGVGVWPGAPNMTIDMTDNPRQRRSLVINTGFNCEVALTPRGRPATLVTPLPVQIVAGGVTSYVTWITQSTDVYVRAL